MKRAGIKPSGNVITHKTLQGVTTKSRDMASFSRRKIKLTE